GMESLLLLVRDQPLPRDADLRPVFRNLPGQSSEIFRILWLENGAEVRDEQGRTAVRGAPTFAQARERDDPVLRTQRLLKSRLQGLFPYTRAVCFDFRDE